MNTQDDLERLLGNQLNRQADQMDGSPLGLGDVKTRAGRIRRNRRLAAGAGVAAAIGIVIPTVMAAGGMLSTTPEPILPADRTDAPVQIARTTLRVDGLERGDAPRVEYFTPDGVVLPGQAAQALPENYQALVPSAADGGWLALSPSRDEVRYLAEDFTPQGGSSATQSLVTTPDRELASWVSPESGAQTLLLHSTVDASVGTAWNFPEFPTVVPVDFVSDDSVLYQSVEPDGSHAVGIAEADGSLTDIPGIVSAISASPVTGKIAVQTKVKKDASGCFAVLDAATTAPVWETCAHSLGAFSPDGRYLLASSPYQSGLGPVDIDVLDAETGEMVASFTQASNTQAALVGVVWESADTFLAVGTEGTTIEVLRFGVDGTLEQATDAVRGDVFGDLPFHFGADRVRGY